MLNDLVTYVQAYPAVVTIAALALGRGLWVWFANRNRPRY